MGIEHYFSSVCILFIFLVQFSYSSDINSEIKTLMTASKPIRGVPSGIWFGPRLGRRLRRNLKFEQGANKDELTKLMDMIHDNPWVVLTMNDLVTEGKRQLNNFTPRLGRESGEESDNFGTGSGSWLQGVEYGVNSRDPMSQRSLPFVPRLGRTSPLHYSSYP